MVRFYKILILLTSYIFLLTSCQEGGSAGDLFGQWRLTDREGLYISFSGSIADFRKAGVQEVYANFQHVGDSLFMQCSSIKKIKADTTFVEDDFGMRPFTNIRVRIDAVDSDRMLLSKDGQHWTLEKY